jgi:hypothetical protein
MFAFCSSLVAATPFSSFTSVLRNSSLFSVVIPSFSKDAILFSALIFCSLRELTLSSTFCFSAFNFRIPFQFVPLCF